MVCVLRDTCPLDYKPPRIGSLSFLRMSPHRKKAVSDVTYSTDSSIRLFESQGWTISIKQGLGLGVVSCRRLLVSFYKTLCILLTAESNLDSGPPAAGSLTINHRIVFSIISLKWSVQEERIK